MLSIIRNPGMTSIITQVSLVAAFLSIFLFIEDERISINTLFVFDVVLAVMGYSISLYLEPYKLGKHRVD